MLAKLVIFKLGLGFKKTDNKSHNFNIYTPARHALTRRILFLLKHLIKLTLNLT